MSDPTSRREFLRVVTSGLAAGALGCTREAPLGRTDDGSPVRDATGQPVLVERPVVRSFDDHAVRIATPLSSRPVAYVSMATREVFVDRGHRDRASWLLDAHISVSTWVWRIPLPGDSPGTPIPPGDEPREFEELPIGAWDPSIGPTEGDIRIVLGRPLTTRVELDCVPVQGSDLYLAAGRIELERCVVGSGEAVREDFRRLASGLRHTDPDCTDRGVEVDVLGWACSV